MNSNNDIAAPFPHRAGTSQALYDGEHSSQSPSFRELELAKLYMNEVSFSKLSVLLSLSLLLLHVAVAVIVAVALGIVAVFE